MGDRCVFCEIVEGREPASLVYEDDAVVAFMDIQPINPGAVVVVPRRHVASLGDLDEASGARLFNVAARLQRSIRECGVRCEGINLFLSDGESAGQEVFHTHLLVVPRFAGDTLRITSDWPERRPREELDRAAAAIRQAHARLHAQLRGTFLNTGADQGQRGTDELGAVSAGENAEAYLAFLVDTVKPLVDESFDVDPPREATGIAGASLGGVISLHALYAHPDIFGFAGVLSPAFWWNGDRLFAVVDRVPPTPARIYLDVGDAEEADNEERRVAYLDGFRRMQELLRRKGYGDQELRAVLDPGGEHNESAWARRLPDAFRFLLRPS